MMLSSADSRADFHIHTSYSDGALEPEEIVDKYLAEGYDVIAITDHDSIDGVWKAVFYAEGKDIRVIKGIEISTRLDGSDEKIHMLGYGIDMHSEELIAAINEMRRWRDERNGALLAALAELGYPVTGEELRAVNGGRFTGKATMAAVLVEKGFAESVDDVFGTIFARPELRSFRKKTYDSSRAIEIIHSAGGLAVMAHPMELKRPGETMDEFRPRLYEVLEKIKEFGVDGIECYHPSASVEQSELLRAYAAGNGLVITRGSDFHSENIRREYEG